jgi:uncharacterized protein (TIGR01319 family)
MSYYLLIDFGSTFTKLTAVDADFGDVIATASHFTTVTTDIREGYHNALEIIYKKIGKKIQFDHKIACSSAAGGLKMAAVGLVQELTVEAAKRVCLGAGARVDLVCAHHLTKKDIQDIVDLKIDIILLAGGADGGNTESVLFNARKLGEAGIKIPVVYAGNKSCQDEIEDIFKEYGIDGYISENVMPKINVLNVKSARDKIREIFLKQIIEGKGIKKIEAEIDRVILPTPEAVLQAGELLSRGYLNERGLGDIVMVDVGGATTDIYSICNSTSRSDVVLHGLEEPFAKRTVEGDLGMRYSAPGIIKAMTKEEIIQISETSNLDLEKEVNYRFHHVDMVPDNDHDEYVDQLLAKICVYRAMNRHVGRIEEVLTPMGIIYNQIGKDLTNVGYVIGTGGVVIKSNNPADILYQTTNIKQTPGELRPQDPKYLLDSDYILAAMGLLSQSDPSLALKIMKRHLMPLEKKV